jgi:hypothetical protein
MRQDGPPGPGAPASRPGRPHRVPRVSDSWHVESRSTPAHISPSMAPTSSVVGRPPPGARLGRGPHPVCEDHSAVRDAARCLRSRAAVLPARGDRLRRLSSPHHLPTRQPSPPSPLSRSSLKRSPSLGSHRPRSLARHRHPAPPLSPWPLISKPGKPASSRLRRRGGRRRPSLRCLRERLRELLDEEHAGRRFSDSRDGPEARCSSSTLPASDP